MTPNRSAEALRVDTGIDQGVQMLSLPTNVVGDVVMLADRRHGPEHPEEGQTPERHKSYLEVAANVISRLETVKILSEIGKFEEKTFDHVIGVTVLCAKAFSAKVFELFSDGISDKEQVSIMRGSLLHDVGKMDPELKEILEKPGALTPDEKEKMCAHTSEGHEILRSSETFGEDDLLLGLTLLHHQVQENYYIKDDDAVDLFAPKSLDLEKFKDILVLFALMDHIEAQTGNRNYILERKNNSKEKVVANLREDVEFFDYPAELADLLAGEEYLWDKSLQQGDIDKLKAAYVDAAEEYHKANKLGDYYKPKTPATKKPNPVTSK